MKPNFLFKILILFSLFFLAFANPSLGQTNIDEKKPGYLGEIPVDKWDEFKKNFRNPINWLWIEGYSIKASQLLELFKLEYESTIQIRNVAIEGDFNIKEIAKAVWSQVVELEKASLTEEIKKKLKAEGVTHIFPIDKKVWIEDSLFKDNLSLEPFEIEGGKRAAVQFKKDVSFSGTQFAGELTAFSDLLFSGQINFFRCKFDRETDFLDTKLLGEADFKEARFSGKTDFYSAQFLGTTDFFHAHFSGATYFKETRFSGSTSFREARFSGETVFFHAQFEGAIDFFYADFSGPISFREARFSGETGFFHAHFSGETGFSEAKFTRTTSFTDARFSGMTDFKQVIFSGVTDFKEAWFSGNTAFKKAEFRGQKISFRRAIFSGTTEFEETEWGDIRFLKSEIISGIDFSEAKFGKGETKKDTREEEWKNKPIEKIKKEEGINVENQKENPEVPKGEFQGAKRIRKTHIPNQYTQTSFYNT